MSDPASGLDTFVAVATGTSALATAVAAAVVARQTFWTRRAVEVAERGASLSQLMAVEAAKTRLDARAIPINVRMIDTPEWPPLEPSGFYGGEPNPLAPGREYHLPRDSHERIMLRAKLRVTNLSDREVTVDLQGIVAGDWKTGDREQLHMSIGANSSTDALLQAERPASQWAEIFAQRQTTPVPDHRGLVTLSDPYDDGVIDSWTLILSGLPLVPVPERDGLWTIAPRLRVDSPTQPWAVSVVLPMVRRYYISKASGQQLGTA